MARPAYFVDVPDSVALPDGGLNYAVNGRLDPALLLRVTDGGSGHIRAAPHYEAMRRAFDVDPTNANRGIRLSYTGIYRTYTRQVQLLMERTRLSPNGACSGCNGRRCYRWGGQVRCLNPGAAGVATPGTSNHGWGLAWDLALRTETGSLISVTPGVTWLERNAAWYGFKNETGTPGSSGYENWHYTYVWGDLTPPYGQSQPPPLPQPEDADMALWARFTNDTTQPYDVAFDATGWRRITPQQVNELRFAQLLRDGQTPGYPQILPADWRTKYPEVNKP